MLRKLGTAIAAAGLALATAAGASPAQAQPAGVKVGVLTCDVSSGFGFVFGSSRSLHCTFSPSPGHAEHYVGTISKFGVDIGYLQSAVMIWAVFAPTSELAPGSLAGTYAGATASATVAVGAGANVLVGGSNKSVTLQPVSIEGNTGLNVAAGIGAITLQYKP